MPESQPIELNIEKFAAGGDGLAFHEGRAVFVPLALPGERVLALVKEDRRDFCQARLVSVLSPSSDRVVPACPIYGDCGGCNLQHLAYPRQVEAKSELVRESFRRIARWELEELSSVPSLPYAYRNRLQLHFTPEGRIGFMKRTSAEVVEAPGCPVAAEPVRRWIEERAGSSRGFEELKNYVVGKDRFIVFGQGQELWVEGRNGVVELPFLGRTIAFHIRGFFQSNLYLLQYLIPDVMQGLAGGSSLADLYCGVGLFSSFLAPAFERVVGVESDPYTIELARRNVPGKGHEFFASTVEDWCQGPQAKRSFDVILVDPPRTGLSATVRAWLGAKKAPIIDYVSCDHATLARDAADLRKAGYRLESLRVFDFFPQTGHVECHARFRLG